MVANTLSLENEVFVTFAFYAAVVIFKTILMSVWTARFRLPRKTPPLPEDYSLFTENGPKSINTVHRDPDIERVRRCHRNDLENVIPFVLIGLLYVLIGPNAVTATWHFRIFAGCRLLYTFAFLNGISVARAPGFLGGLGVNISMSLQVLSATMKYM
ncbi:microsomal glutathione S-transferase 1-like [Mercenaria mercenaria]|uniref:microsomal glutathione S-transferase 1-like n=1 Tax=Mercenaria mercenaria TaxID=6596 RepID=UPI00234EBFE6|nr:microsomal glutathione S-transferase 1-like [Mercenaria mercenaria]